MSATTELRRMLTERGVEWTANDGEHVKETCWPYMGELTAAFAEYDNGTTRFACDTWCFTPTQAVEATLGRGTCHNTEEYPFIWSLTCSECGVHSITEGRGFSFCPNCGRKVVGPTTNDVDTEVTDG